MKSKMGINFWKKELIKQFDLNDIGKDLLNILEKVSPERTLNYILYQFGRLYRDEIIDMYCEKYTSETINMILEDLEEEELNRFEIENYEIKVEESEDDEEEEI